MTIASFTGALGLWRYGWWTTHAIRSEAYRSHRYPALRRDAERVWGAGSRPRRLFFIVTALGEHPDTLRAVLDGICRELDATGVPGTMLFCGAPNDEEMAATHLRAAWSTADLEIVTVRQQQPGKPVALGLLVCALNREDVRGVDLVVTRWCARTRFRRRRGS